MLNSTLDAARADSIGGKSLEDVNKVQPDTANNIAAGVATVAGEEGSPTPESIKELRRCVWQENESDGDNFARFGTKLCEVNPGLYRNGTGRQGLTYIEGSGKVTYVRTGAELIRIIIDSLDVCIVKSSGNVAPWTPPTAKLNAMLGTECFLSNFLPLDVVVDRPMYRDDFTLIRPGYNPAERVYVIGETPAIRDSMETTNMFLDAMSFATNADRTNAVAGALTCLLHNHWPGAKPLLCATGNKSHVGKGTIVEFMRGGLEKADIHYQKLDWPMMSQLQSMLRSNPKIGFVDIDNVRPIAGGIIASAFFESLITSRWVNLASPGCDGPVSRSNDLAVALNTNDGRLIRDLANRMLPIHLEVVGDIDDRKLPIGNPKLEFLPQHWRIIEAELHGMIARWVAAGRPLDEEVTHSMLPWARVIGGILKVNGFIDFLANYKTAKTVDDPTQVAIGTLAENNIGVPKSASEWVAVAKYEGMTRLLFETHQRENDKSMARALGVLFANHLEESFLIDQNGKQTRVKLEWRKKRWNPGKTGSRKYVFRVVDEDQAMADEPAQDVELSDELLASESEPIPLPARTPKRKPR